MSESTIKLHLGCFKRKIHGFTNIDIRNDVGADVVDDCRLLTKFQENSVSLIYTSHMLEHFPLEEVPVILKRWFNLLRPGGILRISVPDFRAICEYYLTTGTYSEVQKLLYGDATNQYNHHYTCYDYDTLMKLLCKVGFHGVQRYDWRDTEHFYIDDYSQCYLPSISYTTRRPNGKIEGKLVSLNVEAIKP
jgi:predicted SAM-dependent methyltransferase